MVDALAVCWADCWVDESVGMLVQTMAAMMVDLKGHRWAGQTAV